ncbi:hypothetical protein ACIBF5_15860 [Micromonospora sp. NPDC050417]
MSSPEETVRQALQVKAQHERKGRCSDPRCTGDDSCPALALTKPGEW